MFKRLLVLIAFLALVFWWLSQRGGEEANTDVKTTTKKVEVSTENETGKTEEVEVEVEVENVETDEGLSEAEKQANIAEAFTASLVEKPDLAFVQETSRQESKSDEVVASVVLSEAERAKAATKNYYRPATTVTKPKSYTKTSNTSSTKVSRPVVVEPVNPAEVERVAQETGVPLADYPTPVQVPVESATQTVSNTTVQTNQAAAKNTSGNQASSANQQSFVKAYLSEWEVSFNTRRVKAGNIKFLVDNSGRFPHDFSVSGIGNLGTVPPNGRATYNVNLRPGTYTVTSNQDNKYEKYLNAQLLVVQ